MTTAATIPTTTTPPIMDRLRAETRDAHDATEAIPFSQAMLERTLPLEAYVGQLAAYRAVHQALDHALASSEDPSTKAVWRDDLAKAPLLDRDLTHFAHVDLAGCDLALHAAERFAAAIDERAARDPIALLGYLYVLEGSTLGATVLRVHIAAAYGLQGEAGLAYYSPYGNAVMPHWKQFKERMNALLLSVDEQERILAAAREAFGFIGEILKAIVSRA
jgi:heme oxygenase